MWTGPEMERSKDTRRSDQTMMEALTLMENHGNGNNKEEGVNISKFRNSLDKKDDRRMTKFEMIKLNGIRFLSSFPWTLDKC